MIKVLVNGARGRMGQETVAAVKGDVGLSLVGEATSADNLAEVIKTCNPDVVIDFTSPHVVFENALTIIECGARALIGTTGLLPEQITKLQQKCAQKKLGCVVAPNFSLAATLMIQCASLAAKWLPQAEIIELHHAQKKDSPSGTALKTAANMIAARGRSYTETLMQKETIPGARGASYEGINIHSVRLTGKLAEQQVILGNAGETLTITHSTVDRKCYMPGVLLACHKVMSLQELVYGLEGLM